MKKKHNVRIKKQTDFKIFLNSFKFNKKFFYTFLLDCTLYIILLIILLSWVLSIKSLGPLLKDAMQPLQEGKFDQTERLILSAQSAQAWFYRIIINSTLAILVGVMAFFTIKYLIYKSMLDQEFEWKLLSKFSLFNLFGILIIILLNLGLQYLFFSFVGPEFDHSASLQIGFFIFQTAYLLVSNFLIISLLLFLTKHKQMKKSFLKFYKLIIFDFQKFIKPILFALLIFVCLNFFFLIALQLPVPVSVIVSVIVFVAYFNWLRLYYFAVLKKHLKHSN
jgi:hypothetical protein